VEVGGAGTFEKSLRSVRPGGTVSVIGVLSGGAGAVPLTPILMQNLRVQGIFVGHRQSFDALNRAFALHTVQPVVDRVFEFSEARAAFEHLKRGAHFGKVVIRVG
ncbi:zinc-binding dehydrogenase, partial [Myxococcus vastator]|uniref:zinc-binding dehydrogenase n=1 Tax=Myxococcus vastator TaxID=2709664 RepID=UPI0013D40C21